MEEAHLRRKEKEDYDDQFCGSGKNWKNKLTMPTIPDFQERKNQTSLDQVKNMTRPVIRNGEIVKDPFIQIDRHHSYNKSDQTNELRAPDKLTKLDAIKHRNESLKEQLFDENEEFEDCVDYLHSQIGDLEV